jgi:capsular polysaccharide transport system permease protein
MSTKAQLAQVNAFAPENPQIEGLHRRARALQSEIDAESAKPAVKGSHQVDKAVEYERLAFEHMFADKQLAAALALLEQAQIDAQRRQLVFERIVPPGKPDAAEPNRVKSVLSVLSLGLAVWGVFFFSSRRFKGFTSEAAMGRHDSFMLAGSREPAIGAAVERTGNIGRIWR